MKKIIIFSLISLIVAFGCKKDKKKEDPPLVIATTETVLISGILLDSNGDPLAKARVEVNIDTFVIEGKIVFHNKYTSDSSADETLSRALLRNTAVYTTTTDEQGHFSLKIPKSVITPEAGKKIKIPIKVTSSGGIELGIFTITMDADNKVDETIEYNETAENNLTATVTVEIIIETVGTTSAEAGFKEIIPLAEKAIFSDISEQTEKDLSTARSGEDVLPQADFNAVKKYFSDALAQDPYNAKGHLGMAIMEIAEFNYNSTLWNIIGQIADLDQGIANVSFTASDVESLWGTDAMNILNSAINHLTITVGDASFATVTLKETNGDEHIISKAGVYIFRSTLYAVRALVNSALAYEIQPVDASDSYSWMNQFNVSDDYSDDWEKYETYAVTTVYDKNVLTLTKTNEEERDNDTIISRTYRDNYLKDAYLKLRAGKDLSVVKADLLLALENLESAYNTVMAQTGDVSKYLIKKSEVERIDEEIQTENPYNLNWQTSSDALSWYKGLLSNPTSFEVNGRTLTVDLAPLFGNQLSNVKDYLPYFSWKDENAWVTEDNDRYARYYGGIDDYDLFYTRFPSSNYWDDSAWGDERWDSNNGNYYLTDSTTTPLWNDNPVINSTIDSQYDWTLGQYKINETIIGGLLDPNIPISKIVRERNNFSVEPIDLKDASGAILPEGSKEIYPDYTFGGLFPGLNQADFDIIFE